MKQELMKYCGNIQQLIYARPIVYKEGRAEYMNAIEAKCGDIFFHSLADKALDISDLSYKGMNVSFLSKQGLQGRNSFDTNTTESRRSIMGGLLFTCGLDNVCAPCRIGDKEYPMHGRMRTTPAEHVNTEVVYEKNAYRLRISGEMREAELFGENLVLRRQIESVLGENSITLSDEIENQAFRPEPVMLMYHFNIGFPFLNESCRIYIPTSKVSGREELSDRHLNRWNEMEKAVDNENEYVFLHEINSDANKDTIVMVVNHDLDIGITIEFNQRNLPYFIEWKSLASGDYVLGLEPSNSSVYGKTYHMQNNLVHYLAPFSTETNRLRISIIDGKNEIENIIRKIISLCS